MNITAQIQGGLGNQLFQYATAKALSIRLKRDLRLDISWFSHHWEDVTPREFLLPELKVDCQLINHSPSIQSRNGWRGIAQRFLPLNPYILKDRPFRFNSDLSTFTPYTSQDVYLMGYWQSYHYFNAIRDLLIKEIRPASALSDHYQECLKKIQNCQSAMVHIRRGDYVHLPVAAKIHGFLGLEYYQKGLDRLLASDPNIHFFVFSDDIGWAKSHLPYQGKVYFIESIDAKNAPVHELFLMSQCQKHLIANSSLSWWGAWLSESATPMVIAPKNWTNDRDKNWDDLLPKHWQKI